MEKSELKSTLHQFIDEVDDEVMLANLYQLLHAHSQQTDILDELNSKQQARLRMAQEQARNGEGIPHETVRTELLAWLTK
jgi:hypothetical protein